MIRADRLAKRYGPTRAVDALSFEIGRGEIVGFLGHNGAGKSTTLRMLTGVLAPDEGQVFIDGLAQCGDDPRPRARIGYLPEGTPLYRSMRVRDYLGFAAAAKGLAGRARSEAVRRACERCDLAGHEQRPIAALSKGFRQRVGLAQALLGDPPVLVLDEPSSGLDPGEVVRIRELVRELGQSRTVLLSTHVLPEIEELCARVLILAAGRLVADGSPAELAREHVRRLRVRARGPARALAELERALRALPGCGAASALGAAAGELALELESADSSAAAPAAAAAAHAAGAELLELSAPRASLEQVFLERTARAALGEHRAGERA